jgi:hypothetical protein
MKQEKLRELVVVLFEKVRENASIDWTIKESVRAKLKNIVKRILRQYGYPPDMQMLATETVFKAGGNDSGGVDGRVRIFGGEKGSAPLPSLPKVYQRKRAQKHRPFSLVYGSGVRISLLPASRDSS